MFLPFQPLLLAALALAAAPSPRLSPPAIQRLINNKYMHPAVDYNYDTEPVLKYIELPVNHVDDNSEKFMNRYWVDDYYYEEGGPVFFIDNGEATAEGMELYLRMGASGSLAEEFKGLLILWEHRFYGTSMPNMTADMQFDTTQLAAYLKYHTIEQALEDIAVFARDFSFDGLPGVDLTPGNTPWVFVGGSYPGARAAWMRQRNPEIFHASLASSAVVELQEDMWEYYHVIETVLDTQGYANCSADMRAVAAYLNDAFDNEDANAVDDFLGLITGPSGRSPLWDWFHEDDVVGDDWENRRINIRAAVQPQFQDFQYVGMGGYLGAFCDGLQIKAKGSGSKRAAIKASEGIFADMDTDKALGVYATILQGVWENVLGGQYYASGNNAGAGGAGNSPAATAGNTPYQYDCSSRFDDEYCKTQITDFSWLYQVCSEFGAFQVMNPSRPSSLLPKIESVDNWIKDCTSFFGRSVSNGPNLAPINKKYGGWHMNPTNTFWTNGELDPWRSVTPQSIEDDAPHYPSTTNIPPEGKTADGDAIFGYVVPGGFHCPDLGSVQRLKNITRALDPADGGTVDTATGANAAHTLFINALQVWLPAFQKHEVVKTKTITTDDVNNGGSEGGADAAAAGEDEAAAAGRMRVGRAVVATALLTMVVVGALL